MSQAHRAAQHLAGEGPVQLPLTGGPKLVCGDLGWSVATWATEKAPLPRLASQSNNKAAREAE